MSQLYYLRIMNFIIFFSLDLQEQSARLYFLFSRVLSEYFSVLNEYLLIFLSANGRVIPRCSLCGFHYLNFYDCKIFRFGFLYIFVRDGIFSSRPLWRERMDRSASTWIHANSPGRFAKCADSIDYVDDWRLDAKKKKK